MVIERTEDEIILRLPSYIDIKEIQRFMDFVSQQELTSKSKATDEEILALSKEIKKGWWSKNRSRFIK